MIKILLIDNNSGISVNKKFLKPVIKRILKNCDIEIVSDLKLIGRFLRSSNTNLDYILIYTLLEEIDFHFFNDIINYANINNIEAIFNIKNNETYYDIDTNLVFLNCKLLRQRLNINEFMSKLDWGDPNVFYEKINLFSIKKQGNLTVLGESQIINNTYAGQGWIFLKCLLGINVEIRDVPNELQSTRLSSPLSINVFGTQIQPITKITKESIALSIFNAVSIENFYITNPLDLNALYLITHFEMNNQARLIILSENQFEKEIFYKLINEEIDSNIPINVLENYYRLISLVGSGLIKKVFESIRNKYIHFFNFHSFIEDIELNLYGNNLFWAGINPVIDINQIYEVVPNNFLEIWALQDNEYIHKSSDQSCQTIYSSILVTLRNTSDQTNKTLKFDIESNQIAQKWARFCHFDALESELILEKSYMLQNWVYKEDSTNARTTSLLCQELNKHIEIINEFFDGSNKFRPYYNIPLFFDPDKLDQSILNEIHHHFELLIGQVWNPSEFIQLADNYTAFSIKSLNNLCHEIEAMQYIKNKSSSIYFSFFKIPTYKFVEQDFDHFTKATSFGDITVFYAQLGKTPLDAWNDEQDNIIGDENISGNRYNSGQFIINLPKVDVSVQDQIYNFNKNRELFDAWLTSKGQDPHSKFTGVGSILLAKLDRTEFQNLNAGQILDILYGYDDIYCIELIDKCNKSIAKRFFTYLWPESENLIKRQ